MRRMEDWPTGIVETLDPLVRRLLAPNPSPFTHSGTQSYIVGHGDVAVIDPGPDLPEHVDALLGAVRGERIAFILCTHTHRDHSPASRPLQAATGAPIVGCPPLAFDDDGPRADAAFDFDYRPDRVLADGETVSGEGWTLEAVATPSWAGRPRSSRRRMATWRPIWRASPGCSLVTTPFIIRPMVRPS